MTTPETPETLYAICAYWAKIISTKGENALHIWVPCESRRYRVLQLVENKKLQNDIFGSVKPTMILIDGYEQEEIPYVDIEKQISESLGYRNNTPFDLDEWLSQHPDEQLVLFMTGLDNVLRHNNTVPLQRLADLSNQYIHLNLKVILFTEVNILESERYYTLLRSSNILQNIHYQPLFAEKDIEQFTHFITEQWSLQVPEVMIRFFVEDIGGHFLLVKEAIRLLRDDPKLTKEEILSAPSMVRKGMAIFEKLSGKDRDTIRNILQGKAPPSISEYLIQLHLVKNGKVGLPYWNNIKDKILDSFANTPREETHSIDFYFTSTERDVFELLTEAKQIVSREQIAEKIWHKGWEDKYSDWAIDQLMHRIREKLKLTSSPYSIQTKKGQGFFITEKD